VRWKKSRSNEFLQALNKLTQAPLDRKLNKNKESKESERKCFQNGGKHCKEVIALPNLC
jgi:hypothetical protein